MTMYNYIHVYNYNVYVLHDYSRFAVVYNVEMKRDISTFFVIHLYDKLVSKNLPKLLKFIKLNTICFCLT